MNLGFLVATGSPQDQWMQDLWSHEELYSSDLTEVPCTNTKYRFFHGAESDQAFRDLLSQEGFREALFDTGVRTPIEQLTVVRTDSRDVYPGPMRPEMTLQLVKLRSLLEVFLGEQLSRSDFSFQLEDLKNDKLTVRMTYYRLLYRGFVVYCEDSIYQELQQLVSSRDPTLLGINANISKLVASSWSMTAGHRLPQWWLKGTFLDILFQLIQEDPTISQDYYFFTGPNTQDYYIFQVSIRSQLDAIDSTGSGRNVYNEKSPVSIIFDRINQRLGEGVYPKNTPEWWIVARSLKQNQDGTYQCSLTLPPDLQKNPEVLLKETLTLVWTPKEVTAVEKNTVGGSIILQVPQNFLRGPTFSWIDQETSFNPETKMVSYETNYLPDYVKMKSLLTQIDDPRVDKMPWIIEPVQNRRMVASLEQLQARHLTELPSS